MSTEAWRQEVVLKPGEALRHDRSLWLWTSRQVVTLDLLLAHNPWADP